MLKTIREGINQRLCDVRNVNYFVQSTNFEIAWKSATVKERRYVTDAIEELDRERIKAFITKKILAAEPFERMGIRKLRDIGRHLGIKHYAKINKLTLIEEIQNVATTLKANSKRKHLQSQETKHKPTDTNGRG